MTLFGGQRQEILWGLPYALMGGGDGSGRRGNAKFMKCFGGPGEIRTHDLFGRLDSTRTPDQDLAVLSSGPRWRQFGLSSAAGDEIWSRSAKSITRSVEALAPICSCFSRCGVYGGVRFRLKSMEGMQNVLPTSSARPIAFFGVRRLKSTPSISVHPARPSTASATVPTRAALLPRIVSDVTSV
jgi:hypothetical protein